MRPYFITLAAVLLAASHLSAQGRIEIVEPTEWAGLGSRGLRIVPRVGDEIRVRGRVFHPSGIRAVRLNGVEVPVVRDPQGEGWAFVGFVTIEGESTIMPVEVAAFPRDGDPFSREFEAELLEMATEEFTPAAAFGRLPGKRWAVIIGISEYEHPGIRDLEYADDDAQALYDFLTSDRAGLGGFPEENIRLLINEDASYAAMNSALRGFLENAGPDDLVMVFIAAHGAGNSRGDYFILPNDADPDDISSTGYRMEDIEDITSRIRYHDLIVIADACHSGAVGLGSTRGFDNEINDVFLNGFVSGIGGSLTFTASQSRQLSLEGSQWGGGHGVFTHFILEGLRGQADYNGNQVVTQRELVEYVREAVSHKTGRDQIPAIFGEMDDLLPLSVVPDGEGRVPPTAGGPTIVIQDTVVIQDSVFIRDSVWVYTAPLPYTAGGALARGLFVPGMGQFTSGRRGVGAAFLVAAGAAVAASLVSKTERVEREFTDQFGNPYTQSVVETSKPYQVIGLGAAAAITVIGAIEAYVHTRAEWDEALASIEVGGEEGGTTLRLGLPEVTPRGLGGRVDLSFASIRFR